MLNGIEAVQHLPNIRSSLVERMLVKCRNRLNRPLPEQNRMSHLAVAMTTRG